MARRGTLYRCHLFSFSGPQTEGITSRWTKHLQPVTLLTFKSGELVELQVTLVDEPALTPDSKVRFDILESDHLISLSLDDRVESLHIPGASEAEEGFTRRERRPHFHLLGPDETPASFVSSFKRSHLDDFHEHTLILEERADGQRGYYLLTWWAAQYRDDAFGNPEYYFIVNIDDQREDQTEQMIPVSRERFGTQEDPLRFARVHEAVFTRAPSGGAMQSWNAAAAALVKGQFRQHLEREYEPLDQSAIPDRITEEDLDREAVRVNRVIPFRYPQIEMSVDDDQVRALAGILTAAQTAEENFLRQWLANRLNKTTDAENYDVEEENPEFQALLSELLDDSFAGPRIRDLASRKSAFHTRDPDSGERRIFVHRLADPSKLIGMLVHEVTHFYTHAKFREWVAATADDRFYKEGFTEYLTREIVDRDDYAEEVGAVKSKVAPYVSLDDIARAYFRGEVWRLEAASEIAKSQFATQIGLSEGSPRSGEISDSRTGAGIVQIVSPRRHYRFLNLGIGEAAPKSEHRSAMQDLVSDPRIEHATWRWVGHASPDEGSADEKLILSGRRSEVFYTAAREVGVAANRLRDAGDAPHESDQRLNAEGESVHARAINRRVELFLSR